jgi:hypothetical protein
MAKAASTGGVVHSLDNYVPRLLTKYRSEVAPGLREHFSYSNVNEIPRLEKITVNMGVGEASRDIKELDAASKELAIITGQKPKLTRAKVSVSTGCGSSWIVWSISLSPVCATSVGFPAVALTAAAITPWV